MTAREQLTNDAALPQLRYGRVFPARPQAGEGHAGRSGDAGRTGDASRRRVSPGLGISECLPGSVASVSRLRQGRTECGVLAETGMRAAGACPPASVARERGRTPKCAAHRRPGFSEFGANLPHGSYDFCGQRSAPNGVKLVMPILFKAQQGPLGGPQCPEGVNGMEIHANTPVGVTGCPKAKTRAQLLAAALKACHKKVRRARKQCEKAARSRYGPAHKASVPKKGSRRS
jgi:hypothetical protein